MAPLPYLPDTLRSHGLSEIRAGQVLSADVPSVARRLRLRDGRRDSAAVYLSIEGIDRELMFAARATMRFGSETVTIGDYVKRVLQRDDLIDVVVDPTGDHRHPYLWIHIEYVDERPREAAFSAKDDGLFALRARAGEKAERVARTVLEACKPAHRFESLPVDADRFVIRYANKRIRSADLRCLSCGVSFEVKKRNRDYHYRVSHSRTRPFSTENQPEGWHVFVFPDMTTHFVRNTRILEGVEDGRVWPGSDRYDSWADLVPPVQEEPPPPCAGQR